MLRTTLTALCALTFSVSPAICSDADTNGAADQWYLTTGWNHITLSSPLYLHTGIKGVEVGIGSDRYSGGGEWYFGDDYSFVSDIENNQQALLSHFSFGKRYSEQITVYGKLGTTFIIIDGSRGGSTIDAGIGVAYNISENVSLKFETVKPLYWLEDIYDFETDSTTLTSIKLSLDF